LFDTTSTVTEDTTWNAAQAATEDATWNATRAATEDATWNATRAATSAVTRDAIEDVTRDAIWNATEDTTSTVTRAATEDATWNAIRYATEDATEAATWNATSAATSNATWAAGMAATEDATRAATWNATSAANHFKNWYVFGDMVAVARNLDVGLPGLVAANLAYRYWQGGNQWSSYASYLNFFKDVVQLPIDFSKWESYETLDLHAGPRFLHEKFCIISERPVTLLVDEQNRPHSEIGPFCKWRDGAALYSVHGVRIPAWIIEQPERLTITSIEAEENTEIQRVMIERFGWDQYAEKCGSVVIDTDLKWGALYGRDGRAEFVKVVNGSPEPDGSFRNYILPVAPGCEPLPADGGDLGAPQKLTALNAVASTYGMTGAQYERSMELRT
jgi:hypothetical protein